jgi:signal peptidase I
MADGPEEELKRSTPTPALKPAEEKAITPEPATEAAPVAQVGEIGAAGTPETIDAGGKYDARSDEPSGLKEWVELLVRAGFWALLIYLFIFQVSVVDGPSMLPNFNGDQAHSDKLVIDKLTYRFANVGRFDVIVFEAVDMDKSERKSRDYIKRVIGLPGETVTIRNGDLWIDGKKIDEPFEKLNYSTGPETGRDTQTFKVPAKHYFVMGDNRGGSHDSRASGIGFVPLGQIKGLVRMRWWPWSRRQWFSRH